jgi:hypothetical protein
MTVAIAAAAHRVAKAEIVAVADVLQARLKAGAADNVRDRARVNGGSVAEVPVQVVRKAIASAAGGLTAHSDPLRVPSRSRCRKSKCSFVPRNWVSIPWRARSK